MEGGWLKKLMLSTVDASIDAKSMFRNILNWIDSMSVQAEEIGFPFIYENVNIIASCRSPLAFAFFNYLKQASLYEERKYLIESSLKTKLVIRQLFKHHQKSLKKKTIIFWAIEPTHLIQQLPVANTLREEKISYLFVTDRVKLLKTLREKGESPLLLNSPLNYIKWFQIKGKIEQKIFNILPDKSTYKNIVLDVLEKNTPSVFKCIDDARMLLNKVNPDVVVLGNDLTLEGATAMQLLKSAKVPAASIMHGNLTSDLHKYHNVDTFFVYGNQSKEYLLELGVASASISVSGAAYLDNIPSRKNSLDEVFLRKLSLNTDNPYFLILLSGSGESISVEHHLKTIENLKRLSLEFPSIQFVVKLHRKDNRDCYTKGVDQHNLIIVDKKQDLPNSIFSWFNGCSAVLTGASTAGNEALLMGVPVITMDFNEEISETDFIKNEISLHVKDYENLKIAINEIVANSTKIKKLMAKTEAYIENCFYARDAKSAKRIAKSLIYMCKSKTL
jgi:UDP-N-acetylglucosamine 2-epimerase